MLAPILPVPYAGRKPSSHRNCPPDQPRFHSGQACSRCSARSRASSGPAGLRGSDRGTGVFARFVAGLLSSCCGSCSTGRLRFAVVHSRSRRSRLRFVAVFKVVPFSPLLSFRGIHKASNRRCICDDGRKVRRGLHELRVADQHKQVPRTADRNVDALAFGCKASSELWMTGVDGMARGHCQAQKLDGHLLALELFNRSASQVRSRLGVLALDLFKHHERLVRIGGHRSNVLGGNASFKRSGDAAHHDVGLGLVAQ
mmetsp:Transcript_19121/g.73111  ORF Transcript_19121/g.73111 Transcript_19121/m.73111 type:complete len:256 (-) Transcript_19121:1035-1802(-)